MESYLRDVGAALASVLGPRLTGAYLHGSLVLGGFDARRSDVDVLAVCAGPLTASDRARVAALLRPLPGPALDPLAVGRFVDQMTARLGEEPGFA